MSIARDDFEHMVAQARRRHGWTLEEIAGKLDVSLHTVRSWLKPEGNAGGREAPSWAGLALTALVTGKAVTERRGDLTVTYAPATRGGRP